MHGCSRKRLCEGHGAYAFDYCDCLWFLVVAGTLDVAFGGARCVYQAFKLKTRDYIGVVSAAILSVDFCPVDKIVAGGKDYGAERFGGGAIGIVVADCCRWGRFLLHTPPFALGKFPTGIGIDGWLTGNGLSKWLVDSLSQR